MPNERKAMKTTKFLATASLATVLALGFLPTLSGADVYGSPRAREFKYSLSRSGTPCGDHLDRGLKTVPRVAEFKTSIAKTGSITKDHLNRSLATKSPRAMELEKSFGHSFDVAPLK